MRLLTNALDSLNHQGLWQSSTCPRLRRLDGQSLLKPSCGRRKNWISNSVRQLLWPAPCDAAAHQRAGLLESLRYLKDSGKAALARDCVVWTANRSSSRLAVDARTGSPTQYLKDSGKAALARDCVVWTANRSSSRLAVDVRTGSPTQYDNCCGPLLAMRLLRKVLDHLNHQVRFRCLYRIHLLILRCRYLKDSGKAALPRDCVVWTANRSSSRLAVDVRTGSPTQYDNCCGPLLAMRLLINALDSLNH
ncbi:hypothetical protein R3P38DRAFT_2803055 [Favolaschia claudopus]|uniref:Uncharacterized protein n=1 Tax=Favolaschia claudopus TaxID=2862362 RepID=A0AAV9ZUN1_9AGAR